MENYNYWVKEIIEKQIKEFDSLCDELISPYDEKSASACIRRITLKRAFTEKYEAIVDMLKIAYALDHYDSYEFQKAYDDLYMKYEVTGRS